MLLLTRKCAKCGELFRTNKIDDLYCPHCNIHIKSLQTVATLLNKARRMDG